MEYVVEENLPYGGVVFTFYFEFSLPNKRERIRIERDSKQCMRATSHEKTGLKIFVALIYEKKAWLGGWHLVCDRIQKTPE